MLPHVSTLRETDLYAPIRAHLVSLGYTVRAEVDHCDITATRGDELLVIELKRHLSIDLLIQATERQRITDSVYVAVPQPSKAYPRGRWRDAQRLLRRLALGLIVVDLGVRPACVEVVFHPLPAQRQKLKRRKRAVLREMSARSYDGNEGGSTGRKLMTGYRENAVRIAYLLRELGPQAPRDLRARGTGDKTLSILSNNYYGWFERVDRGIYTLTRQGRKELKAYPEVVARLAKLL